MRKNYLLIVSIFLLTFISQFPIIVGAEETVIPVVGNIANYFSGNFSIDGNYLVGGDWRYNDETGCAYVYQKNGNNWVEMAKLVASDGAIHDEFGGSVAISGDYIVVGANDAGTSGAAYIFHRVNSNWVEMAKLVVADGDMFGYSVAIFGNYILIGNANTSFAHIFHQVGDQWIQQAKLAGHANLVSFSESGDAWVGSTCYHLVNNDWYPCPQPIDTLNGQFALNQGYVWSYLPTVNPVTQSNPANCQPFAVGDLASGNLNLQVGLPAFSSGVDVYLAIGFADALYLIDGSNGLQPAAGLTTLPKWKANVSAAVNESLYGDIPTSLLPAGVYNLYVLVMPAGETDFSHYYFWATSFDHSIDPNNIDNDGDGFTENQGDCKDDNSAIFPGATEICGDAIDNNCNNQVDESCVQKDFMIGRWIGTVPSWGSNWPFTYTVTSQTANSFIGTFATTDIGSVSVNGTIDGDSTINFVVKDHYDNTFLEWHFLKGVLSGSGNTITGSYRMYRNGAFVERDTFTMRKQ